MCLKSTSEQEENKMCLFKRKDVFKEVERIDAEITARDNRLNKEKDHADNQRNQWGYPVVLPTSGTEGSPGDSQGDLFPIEVVIHKGMH